MITTCLTPSPVDPKYYQFAEIYKDIHEFLKKLGEIEKQINELKDSKQEESTIEYVRNELRGRLPGLQEKIKKIELSIKAFIALQEFRDAQDYLPSSIKRSESLGRANTAKLSTIDPLIGKIPQGFEEEKACLEKKLKEVKQRVYSIETNLRDDQGKDERLGKFSLTSLQEFPPLTNQQLLTVI